MITSKQVKTYLKALGYKTVRTSTTATKHPWITAWIPADRSKQTFDKLVYTEQPFSVALRQSCLKIVYPNHADLQAQSSAGNVGSFSIAMRSPEWETLLSIGGGK